MREGGIGETLISIVAEHKQYDIVEYLMKKGIENDC